MKRIRNRILCMILTVIITVTAIPHIAAKNTDSFLIGDVNGDNAVSILDATSIQRRLALMTTLSDLSIFLGDVNHDDSLDILDVTIIQRKLAEISDDFWTKSYVPNAPTLSMDRSVVYPNTSSRIATSYAGAPVKFTLSTNGLYLAQNTVRIQINTEEISAGVRSNYHFSHTFEEPGDYTITIDVSNAFGMSREFTYTHTVISSPDAPYLCDGEINRADNTATVKAAGGTAPYRYKYYIRHYIPEPPTTNPTESESTYPSEPYPGGPEPTEPAENLDFNVVPYEGGTFQLVSDYTSTSYIKVPSQMLIEGIPYEFYVSILDSNNTEVGLFRIQDS